MTDLVEPDVIVRTALQRLPVPPHGDGFWARLEASLDAETPVPLLVEPAHRTPAQPAPPAEPAAEVVELEADRSAGLVPPAFRRASNVVLVAVAAAAVVVVGVAGNRLLAERQGSSGAVTSSLSASPSLESMFRRAQDDGAPLEPVAEEHADASAEAVLAWIADLGAGDADGAWRAMGAASRAEVGSQEAFEGLMTDLAEGFGAWSGAEPDEVLVTPVAEGDEGTIVVVTLVGTVEQDGGTELRADAFPVQIDGDDVTVEPFATAGDLEVVVPEPAGSDDGAMVLPAATDDELVFVLPVDAEAPVVRIDGGEALVCGEAPGTELHDLEGATGRRCAYAPEGGIEPGSHVVTVAFLGADDRSITAESIRFEAA